MAFKFNPFTGNFDDVADVAEKLEASSTPVTDNSIVRFDGTTGRLVQASQVTVDDSGNVIIAGDLTVNGTTTTINTATLDVEDTNISVNVNGNDVSAEGAGLTVTRAGTDGSFIYEDALTSKFKIGALGSEIEIADISSSQTLTNKTIDADNNTITDIANANIASAANIELSKLAALTVSRALTSNGTGEISVATTTTAELNFLSGVTSSVQTQIDGKLDDFTSSNDNRLMRSDGTTGEAIQDSTILVDDFGNMNGINSITLGIGGAVSAILDEDNMSSDSPAALATQQSIKAYVDNSIASGVYNVVSDSGAVAAAANTTYLIDTSSSTASITLPAPSANTYIRIKDSLGNCNTNNITINPNAAETIDGAASTVLQSDFEAKTFVSDGTNWFCF